ncbi:chemotaxis protein methyltransferase CheR [Mariprofundus micogutta]|uniref:protein-glutamate O-methyltransferase n=1 Tax=Mariprofundus micogutta TaxID=1921010 RepID=A0A1L8CNW7_9PROT|nr:protein-glutamate O-methyltransferase CheR [Mariprofundus micogutta]GAV20529.1 chemotaxis protein methyltransferase CheR [Mariprofundus micogutta]
MTVSSDRLKYFAAFVRREIGQAIDDSKLYLIRTRLLPMARAQGLASLDELIDMIRRDEKGEVARMALDKMTTNETLFFRDAYPFKVLEKELFPSLGREKGFSGRIRIWSAAASTGQEAYSIAMTAKQCLPAAESRVKITATDISAAAIAYAKQGLYKQMEVQRGLPVQTLVTHFEQQDSHHWQVKANLKSMVRFQQENLISPRLVSALQQDGPFDIVFCRNVLIYFDVEQRKQVIDSIAQLMEVGGWLFTGAGEMVTGNRSSWSVQRIENRPVWRLVSKH